MELLDRLRREETFLPVLDHSGDGTRGPVDGFEKYRGSVIYNWFVGDY